MTVFSSRFRAHAFLAATVGAAGILAATAKADAADCSLNPLTYGGCLQNAGSAVVTGAEQVGSAVVNTAGTIINDLTHAGQPSQPTPQPPPRPTTPQPQTINSVFVPGSNPAGSGVTQGSSSQSIQTTMYNIVKAGGLTQADSNLLLSQHPTGLINQDGGSVLLKDAIALQAFANNGVITQAEADKAIALISNDGGSLVAQGGGNLYSLLISQDGGSFTAAQAQLVVGLISESGSGAVAANGAGVLSNDSGGIISHNGSTAVSNNSTGIISHNGSTVVSNDSGGIISHNGSTLISESGSGLISESGSGIISHNGSTLMQGVNSLIATASGAYQVADVGDSPTTQMGNAIQSTVDFVAAQNAQTAVDNASAQVAQDRANLDQAVQNNASADTLNALNTKLTNDATAAKNAVAALNTAVTALGQIEPSLQSQLQQNFNSTNAGVTSVINTAENGAQAEVSNAVQTAALGQQATAATNAAAAEVAAANAGFAAINKQPVTDTSSLKAHNAALAQQEVLAAQAKVDADNAYYKKLVADKASASDLASAQDTINNDTSTLNFDTALANNNYSDKVVDSDTAATDLQNAQAALAAYTQAFGGKAPSGGNALATYNLLVQLVQYAQDQANITYAAAMIAKAESETPPDTATITAQTAISSKAQADLASLVSANPQLSGSFNVTALAQSLAAPAVQVNNDQKNLNAIQAAANAASAAAAAQGKNANLSSYVSQSQAAQSQLAADQAALNAPPTIVPVVVPSPQQPVLGRLGASQLLASASPTATPAASPSTSPSPCPSPCATPTAPQSPLPSTPSGSANGPTVASLQKLVQQYTQEANQMQANGNTVGYGQMMQNVAALQSQINGMTGTPTPPSPPQTPPPGGQTTPSPAAIATAQQVAALGTLLDGRSTPITVTVEASNPYAGLTPGQVLFVLSGNLSSADQIALSTVLGKLQNGSLSQSDLNNASQALKDLMSSVPPAQQAAVAQGIVQTAANNTQVKTIVSAIAPGAVMSNAATGGAPPARNETPKATTAATDAATSPGNGTGRSSGKSAGKKAEVEPSGQESSTETGNSSAKGSSASGHKHNGASANPGAPSSHHEFKGTNGPGGPRPAAPTAAAANKPAPPPQQQKLPTPPPVPVRTH